MGRLIDADELKKSIIKKLGIASEEFLLESEKVVFEEIDKAPTVEAIPVEWLKDQIEIASSNGEDDYVNALDWTVMKWQMDAEEKEE